MERGPPKTNLNYWRPKLKANIERDIKTENKLDEEGWKVLTLWECELEANNNWKIRLKHFLGDKVFDE